jgi:uncharacterized protein YlxW (UPF0749 family)
MSHHEHHTNEALGYDPEIDGKTMGLVGGYFIAVVVGFYIIVFALIYTYNSMSDNWLEEWSNKPITVSAEQKHRQVLMKDVQLKTALLEQEVKQVSSSISTVKDDQEKLKIQEKLTSVGVRVEDLKKEALAIENFQRQLLHLKNNKLLRQF